MLNNNKNHATYLKGIDKLLNYCSLENVFTNETHSINDKTKIHSLIRYKTNLNIYILLTGKII